MTISPAINRLEGNQVEKPTRCRLPNFRSINNEDGKLPSSKAAAVRVNLLTLNLVVSNHTGGRANPESDNQQRKNETLNLGFSTVATVRGNLLSDIVSFSRRFWLTDTMSDSHLTTTPTDRSGRTGTDGGGRNQTVRRSGSIFKFAPKASGAAEGMAGVRKARFRVHGSFLSGMHPFRKAFITLLAKRQACRFEKLMQNSGCNSTPTQNHPIGRSQTGPTGKFKRYLNGRKRFSGVMGPESRHRAPLGNYSGGWEKPNLSVSRLFKLAPNVSWANNERFCHG